MTESSKPEVFFSFSGTRNSGRYEPYSRLDIGAVYHAKIGKTNVDFFFQIIMNKKTGKLERLTVNTDNITSLHIFRQDNKFTANKIEKVLYKKTSLSEGIIKSSLFRAAQKDNIEAEVIVEFARIFGFEIDFQRDI